jgi:hypothetical protein
MLCLEQPVLLRERSKTECVVVGQAENITLDMG